MQKYALGKSLFLMLSFLSFLNMSADRKADAPRKFFTEILPDKQQPISQKCLETMKRMQVCLSGEKKDQSETESRSVGMEDTEGDPLSEDSMVEANEQSLDAAIEVVDDIVDPVLGEDSGDNDSGDPSDSNKVTFLSSLKEYSRTQWAGLAGIVAILSYAGYTAYNWWRDRAVVEPLYITEDEQKVIRSFTEHMEQDIESLKTDKRNLSLTESLDLSEMTNEDLAAEFDMLQKTFVSICKSCEENADNLPMLESFCEQVKFAIDMMLEYAVVVSLENEAVAEQEQIA